MSSFADARHSVLFVGWLVGCTGSKPDLDAGPAVTLAQDQVTAATVTWSTRASVGGYVEWGLDTNYGRATVEGEPAEVHTAVLLGNKADTIYHYRTVNDGVPGADHTFRTGPLPDGLPTLTVTGESTWRGFLFFGVMGPTNAIIGLDPDGDIVWYCLDDRGGVLWRARRQHDSAGVAYNISTSPGAAGGTHEILNVGWAGDKHPVVAGGTHHDWDWLAEPDQALMTREVLVEDDAGQVVGDQLIEVSPDGTIEVVWDAFDNFDPQGEGPDEEPDDGSGWTHLNTLHVADDGAHAYVGARNFSSLIKANLETGGVEWVFGGTLSDWSFTNTDRPFIRQHQFEFTYDEAGAEDSVVLFDNGSGSEQSSRIVEFALDASAMTATEVWSYTPSPPMYCLVMGDVQRVESGNYLVTWSTFGQLDEVTPDKEVVWRVTDDSGYGMAYVTQVATLP